MQIVDTSLIFKKRWVDLEANTFKSQKSEFYEAWLANFGPFFPNLGAPQSQIAFKLGYE